MTLINRAAINQPAAVTPWMHLPPYGPRLITVAPIVRASHPPIPLFATGAMGIGKIENKQHGYEIDINGRYVFSTPQEGLLWQQNLEEHLRDSVGEAYTLDVCDWFDDSSTVKFIYRNCEVVDGPTFSLGGSRNTARSMDYHMRFISLAPYRYDTAANATRPGAGAYEGILYTTGTPGTPPAGGEIVVTITQSTRQVVIDFPGVMDLVTDVNNQVYSQKKIWFHALSAVTVRNLQIIGGVAPGSGTTTIRGSTTDYASAGSGQDISALAAATTSAAVNAGEITIAANGYLYLYVTAAGSHEGLQVAVEVEIET